MQGLKFIMVVGALVTVSAVSSTAPADARGRFVRLPGVDGGAIARRQVSREPGSAQVTRGILTLGGHAMRSTRSTDWGGGQVHNITERQYRNGSRSVREGRITRNADGSVSTMKSRSGIAGNSQSSAGTIRRTDDGYVRSRSASTSNGRGYDSTRDVSIADQSVTIDRNLTSRSGRSVSSSRTYPRPK